MYDMKKNQNYFDKGETNVRIFISLGTNDASIASAQSKRVL